MIRLLFVSLAACAVLAGPAAGSAWALPTGALADPPSANASLADASLADASFSELRADSSDAPARTWIFLADRPEPAAVPSAPARTTRRRAHRGIHGAARWTRPVSPTYLAALADRGITPHVRSRWLHAVSASLTPSERRRVAALPFVRGLRPVARGTVQQRPGRIPLHTPAAPASPLLPARSASTPFAPADSAFYGASYEQLRTMNALAPLSRDVNGRGVRIGFMDTGYRAFRHPTFDALRQDGRLISVRDFTSGEQINNHGGGVASAAVGYSPGILVGPAHQAEVLAATTEFTQFERNVEEDYFVAGLEWLERNGADVVNVSLGYARFDDGERSYTVDDLDGDTAVTTRAVDRAAALGLTVVVSAGNSGCSDPASCWYYVSTPADADSAIAVGAVGPDSAVVSFSSRGPTADGRIKPDVAAQGAGIVAAWEEAAYAQVGGTSFASPLVTGVVAQMLQVNDALSPMHIRRILRQTASQARSPDPDRGWGIVNAEAAVREAERLAREAPPPRLQVAPPYPNPTSSRTTFTVQAPSSTDTLHLAVYDLLGRRVRSVARALAPGPNRITLSVADLAPGLYLVRLRGTESVSTHRVTVVR